MSLRFFDWIACGRVLGAALALLACSLSVLAQRVNFEEVVNDGHEFSRSWVDINNDGKDDYCVFTGSDAQTLECYLSTGAGFNPTRFTAYIGNYDKRRYWWIDLNGDGQVDLCRQMNGTSPFYPAPVTVQCRMGPSFSVAAQTTLPNYFQGACEFDTVCTPPSGAGVRDERDLFFTDANQDGTNDLCYLHTSNDANYDLRCVLFVGGSVFAGVPSSGRSLTTYGNRDWPRGFHDVNGDGFPDFCGFASSRIYCALNSPSGFAANVNLDSDDLNVPIEQHQHGAAFVDINGDGNTDFCRIVGTTGSYQLSCRLSTGAKWDTTERSSATFEKGDPENRWWADINGDGLPDFCRAVGSDPDDSPLRSSLWCRLARGGDSVNGLFGTQDLVFEGGVTDAIHFGSRYGGRTFCDPFGTGIQTLCRATFRDVAAGTSCYEGDNGQTCYTTYDNKAGVGVGVYGGLVSASVPTPDAIQASPPLLSAYTDGLGAETRITYMPLSNPQIYAKSGVGTAFPRLQIAQPRSAVVFESRAWRAGSTTATLTGNARYFYKDLRVDNRSGSRGFRERWFLTEGSNTLEHTTYFQGLGPTVDASSLLDDNRELGQVKDRRVYSIDTSRVREDLPGWVPPAGAYPRQRKLSATLYQASAVPASMSSGAVSPPTQDNPFMLLKRSVNTLGNTTTNDGSGEFVNLRLRPVESTRTESWDWNGPTAVPMPIVDTTVKTSYYGNAVSMEEKTTDGSQVWTKKTTNVYAQDNTATWLLGRLTSTKVESTAPTAEVQLAAAPTSYGTSPNANSTSSSVSSIVTLSPPAIANTQVGQTTTANATLTNTASHPVVVTVPGTASVTGQGLSFVSTTCGTQLAAGASCAITVRFAPTSVTNTTGTVSIDTAAGVRVASFTAASQASYSTAILTSAAPNLGTVMWGSTSPTATASFRNDGNAAMTLMGLSGLSSRFQVTANTCSSVAPGAVCSMTLAMPTANAGSDSSAVTTAGATTNASFSVSGTVQSVVSRWSVTSLAFGTVTVGQSSTQNLTLFNDGFQAAASWSAALTNLPAGFTANTSACASVAAGSGCTVSVTFAPTASQSYSGSNVRPASVSYTANTLAVNGSGVFPAATVALSPTTVSFGTSIPKGGYVTKTVSVTNSGTVAATGMGYTITSGGGFPGYSVSRGTCPVAGGTLVAGASCALSVTFEASCTGGTKNGTLSVSSNNLPTPKTASLTATVRTTGSCL